MGHGKIRIDKTCLNCNHVVENKFCPNCGQENTETRKSFHYLFTHFVEDLTHYDGSFWKTIKALLFKPGKLTKEYLAGKRKLYVPPVKLYIFISFVAFLLPKLLPDYSFVEKTEEKVKIDISDDEIRRTKVVVFNGREIATLNELDSIQDNLPQANKMSWVAYQAYKFTINNKTKAAKSNSREKIRENITHNLPKVLFVYMPTFAFFLWLFHNKKRWYYFDSGVFTLHYFGFLLLLFTLGISVEWISDLFYQGEEVSFIIALSTVTYAFFYFFRAHSTFYEEKKYISRIKSLILFIINIFLMILLGITLVVFAVNSSH